MTKKKNNQLNNNKNLKKVINKETIITNVSEKINSLKVKSVNDKNQIKDKILEKKNLLKNDLKIDYSTVFKTLQDINLKKKSPAIKKTDLQKKSKNLVEDQKANKMEPNYNILAQERKEKKINNPFKFKKNLSGKQLKKKIIRKIRRILKCNKKLKDRFYSKFRNQSPKISHSIKIWVKANNVFCICTDNKTNKTVNFCNSGMYKIPTSKRKVKHTYMLIFNKFIAETKKKVKIRGLMFTISCPKRLRYKLLKRFPTRFKKMPLVVNVLDKKIFNGCRPAKKIRKKRRIMRVYK